MRIPETILEIRKKIIFLYVTFFLPNICSHLCKQTKKFIKIKNLKKKLIDLHTEIKPALLI